MIEASFGPLDGSTGSTGGEHGGLQPGGLAQPEVVGSGYEGIVAGRADAKAMTVRASAEVEKCMTVDKKGERGRKRAKEGEEGRKPKVGFMKGREETKGW